MDGNPIIAGTDGSEDSLRAVEWAAREAVRRTVALRVVSAPELPPQMSPGPAGSQTVAGLVVEGTREALASAAERAAEVAPGLTIDTELLSGPPAQALIDAAHHASMLVVGSRGAGGFAAMTLGSVSRYAAVHSPVPVVIAREESMAVHREIVAGIRDPDESAALLEFAFQEAVLRKARLLALHAWFRFGPAIGSRGAQGSSQRAAIDPEEVQAYAAMRLDETLAVWRQKYRDVQTGWEVVHAHPGRVLAGASARADLVVLGKHREHDRTGVGSVTHAVLNHAHGPVACVPPD